jgi:galactokinase
MTGGGFGGCTVSLVAPGADEALRAAVLRDYPKRTGLAAKVYAVSTVDGAGAIKSM